MSDLILLFLAIIAFAVLIYFLGNFQGYMLGIKAERAKWLRWMMSNLEQAKIVIDADREEAIELAIDMVEKTQ